MEAKKCNNLLCVVSIIVFLSHITHHSITPRQAASAPPESMLEIRFFCPVPACFIADPKERSAIRVSSVRNKT